MTKSLLWVTAIAEGSTAVALLVFPSLVASVLLGMPLEAPAGVIICRVAGAALLSLALSCWLALRDEKSRAATGLVAALLVYNVLVAALLAHARMGLGLTSDLLAPVVLLHGAMAVCCAIGLRAGR